MKMEQIECSETSAYKIQTPGNPKESIELYLFSLPLRILAPIHYNVIIRPT